MIKTIQSERWREIGPWQELDRARALSKGIKGLGTEKDKTWQMLGTAQIEGVNVSESKGKGGDRG